jgi:hypothetical protein
MVFFVVVVVDQNARVYEKKNNKFLDRKFMQTFTTTYQSFTVPTLLLNKLMERYQVCCLRALWVTYAHTNQSKHKIPPNVPDVDDKRRQAIQLRVAVVLKYWTDQHFEHFDEEVLQNLYTFLTQCVICFVVFLERFLVFFSLLLLLLLLLLLIFRYLMKDGHVDMAKALHAFISNKVRIH